MDQIEEGTAVTKILSPYRGHNNKIIFNTGEKIAFLLPSAKDKIPIPRRI